MARLLKAGADVNAGDYDKRTPLHIAAAEVNLTAVSIEQCPCFVWRSGVDPTGPFVVLHWVHGHFCTLRLPRHTGGCWV